MRRLFDSTLNRLVLAYGLVLLLAFVSIGAVSLLAFDRLVERDSQQTVRAEHEGLMEVSRDYGLDGLTRVITARVREPVNREAVYLLFDGDGRVRAGHRKDLPVSLPRHSGWLRFPWRAAPESEQVLAYVQQLPDGGWLLTGHTTGEQRHLRELIQRSGW